MGIFFPRAHMEATPLTPPHMSYNCPLSHSQSQAPLVISRWVNNRIEFL